MKKRFWALWALLFWAAMSGGAFAAPVNAVTAGELVIDPPTLINLGFEWVITGDDNRNARVEVSYRKKGEKAWKRGHAAAAAAAASASIRAKASSMSKMPNMFAGSILDLEENTAYEVRLVAQRSRWRQRQPAPSR